MPEQEKPISAVYVPWMTFFNAVDRLSKAEMPNVIDRTVFSGMNYSIQSQLFSGMKFLGLIDDKNRPTVELDELVSVPDKKLKIAEILRKRYPALFALNLKKSTPQELESTMTASYNVKNDTCDKAVRFFLAAAEFAGIELSSLLSVKKTTGVPRAVAARKRTGRKQPPLPDENATLNSNAMKTIKLPKVGGVLEITGTFNAFELRGDERTLVYQIIDLMTDYAAKVQSAE